MSSEEMVTNLRTGMSTRNRVIGGLALLLTLVLSGCIYHKVWIPASQMKTQIGARVDVLTKDGSVYRFENAAISPASIRGLGIKLGEDELATRLPVEIQRDSVALVQLYEKDSKTIVAGLLVAGVIIAANQANANHGKGADVRITYPWNGNFGSCPLAMSYDGTRYQLESETYVGAICQGLARTATDVLKRLAVSDGGYRIKIANESPETHYTDKVRLLAADHPIGTRLVATALGALHSVSSPTAPVAAISAHGRDVRSLVSVADSMPWETDLRAIDPNRTEDLRDGVICEFRRPAHTRAAKLVVTCVNTDLGDFALAKIFGMRGPGKLGWYHELNTNPLEQRKLVQWMLREGGIDISVWKNEHWERQAVIPGVGGRAWTDRLVELHLGPTIDSTVRVKIEVTAGLWRIDEVAIDYSEDTPVELTECPLVSALTQDGSSVAPNVAASDASYHQMLPGEWAELTFDMVATRPGFERSFVLETTGYYYAWFAQNETDEHEQVDRILTEPLFGSRLYMGEYLKWKAQMASR